MRLLIWMSLVVAMAGACSNAKFAGSKKEDSKACETNCPGLDNSKKGEGDSTGAGKTDTDTDNGAENGDVKGTLYVPAGSSGKIPGVTSCTTDDSTIAVCAKDGAVNGSKVGSTVAVLADGSKVNVIVFDPKNPPDGVSPTGGYVEGSGSSGPTVNFSDVYLENAGLFNKNLPVGVIVPAECKAGYKQIDSVAACTDHFLSPGYPTGPGCNGNFLLCGRPVTAGSTDATDVVTDMIVALTDCPADYHDAGKFFVINNASSFSTYHFCNRLVKRSSIAKGSMVLSKFVISKEGAHLDNPVCDAGFKKAGSFTDCGVPKDTTLRPNPGENFLCRGIQIACAKQGPTN